MAESTKASKEWLSHYVPNKVSTESIFYGKWKLTPADLSNCYSTLSNRLLSWKKVVFSVVLIPDKNLFVILAGSTASVPLNILTASSREGVQYFVLLITAFVFYLSFLYFSILAYKARSESSDFIPSNDIGIDQLPKARRNIDFAACMHYYNRLIRWFLISLVFFVLTVLFLFAGKWLLGFIIC